MSGSLSNSAGEPLNKKFTSVGGAVSFVGKLSPQLASYAAKKLFMYPGPVRLSTSEREFLARGVPLELYSGRFRLRVYRWGQGPAVLLVHGWGSSPARFKDIVESLCGQGFSVLGFDQPGHGGSDGRFVSLLDIAQSVKDIAGVYGPFNAVLAHSLGALALGLVCSKTQIAQKLVLISPLTGSDSAVETFGLLTGIDKPILATMRESIEKELSIDLANYSFEKLIGEIAEPILVVHDEDDRLTLASRSAEWAESNPRTQLVLTKGLGHRRILHDPKVIEVINQFLGRARSDVRQQLFSDYAL